MISLLILVLALGAIGCGGNGGGDGSDPESTVRSSVKALETRDAGIMVGYCAERPSDAEIEELQQLWDSVDSFRVYNITTDLISQSGDEATVRYELDYEITVSGETESGHRSDTADLVKIDSGWYMADCNLDL